jgi:hypothetical protein
MEASAKQNRERARAVAWVVSAMAALHGAQSAQADEFLIRETESLRDSLAMNDPSRIPLTLRLADLLVEEASRVSRQDLTQQDPARRQRLQSRALALFDEALRANPGALARIKIDFQRARLLSELGQVDRSVALWMTLAQQKESIEIAREAALRLAESGDTPHAARWYQLALELCQGGDLCSYIHFKRAWLFRQASGGIADEAALRELELGLWDSHGQIREEALRDYLVFWADRPRAREAMAKLEPLAEKLGRPALLADLAEAFLVGGQTQAGAEVLAQVNRREPRLHRLVRLAELRYGARDWDAFQATLAELSSESAARLFQAATESERVESEKFLRRLVIQLDGERISQKERVAVFQQTTLAYLSFFSSSPERLKFQEGWLAAESDPKRKLEQLALWISQDPTSVSLREWRASIAQKEGLPEVIAEEMAALVARAPAGEKSREYKYLLAKAHLDSQRQDLALRLFEELARFETSGLARPDRWAIQAQNLVLDLLNQRKDWSALIARANAWLDAAWARDSAALKADAALAKELADMAEIRRQARFQGAVASGETAEALATFVEFCRGGVLAEKSCENARVLSVKRRDQASLLAVLELMGKSRQSEFAQELEAAGYFARAAQVLPEADLLKQALLWELAGDRAAVARKLEESQRQRHQAALGARLSEKQEQQERLWLAMAIDHSDLLRGFASDAILRTLMGSGARARFSEWLEGQGKGNPSSRKELFSASFETGPQWAKLVLAEISTSLKQSELISFYGRNSRQLFEKRLAALARVAKRADEFFPRCGNDTRAQLAAVLQGAYERFAQEIRKSPIPESLPEASVAELKNGLELMARPFDEKAQVYAQAVAAASQKSVANAGSGATAGVTAGVTDDRIRVSAAQSRSSSELIKSAEAALETLHQNPESLEALTALREAYREQGRLRLAEYFEGRLQTGGGSR